VSVQSALLIDADWLRGEHPAAAFATGAERLELPDGTALDTDGKTGEDVAVAVLASLAGRAARLARTVGGEAGVEGTGLLARFTRILLGLDDREPEHPRVIVDTIGSAESITDGLRRLSDLGVLVLTAPTEPAIALDLYPDAHKRGLTIAGMPLLEHPGRPPAPAPDALVHLARQALCEAGSESRGPALWYRRQQADGRQQ
jgi:hypothetical protein